MTDELPVEFGRFVDFVARNERKAPNTVRAYTTHLRHYVAWCDTNGVDPLRAQPQDVAAWQRDASETLVDAALVCYSSTVRRCYRWCHSRVSGRLLDDDPAAELHVGSVPLGEPHPIPDADLDIALQTAVDDHELLTWLLIEAGTGCRHCQVASLTKHRVHYQPDGRAVLRVRGKGKEQRLLAGRDIAEALRRYTTKPGPLWFNAEGRPVSAGNIAYRINTHLSRLGISERGHSLRHWYAHRASQITGGDMRTVQDLLGHSDLKYTALYVPPSGAGRIAVADQLAAELAARSAS